jgi:hypothetical protein
VTLDYANREIYLENPNYKDGKEETFTISQPDPRKRGRASGLGFTVALVEKIPAAGHSRLPRPIMMVTRVN